MNRDKCLSHKASQHFDDERTFSDLRLVLQSYRCRYQIFAKNILIFPEVPTALHLFNESMKKAEGQVEVEVEGKVVMVNSTRALYMENWKHLQQSWNIIP